MRKLLSIIIATLSVATLHATEPSTTYCTVRGNHLVGNTNGYIGSATIDYGQPRSAKEYLVDDNGKRLHFDSVVILINYMAKAGWKLESTYTQYSRSLTENRNLDEFVITIVLSKEITSDEEITDGFMTRKMFESENSINK